MGTEGCTYIDYGPGTMEKRPTVTSAHLKSEGGATPEIFLLFKPGHYDILVRLDGTVAKMLSQQESDIGKSSPLETTCLHFAALVNFVEERLTKELSAKRGSDLEFLHGQLESLVFPLQDVMKQCAPARGDLMGFLFPCMTKFLRPAPVSMPSVSSRPPTSKQECCICMEDGATAIALCGCAYHPKCLAEYVLMEKRPLETVCCHFHEVPLGSQFVNKHAYVTGEGAVTPLTNPQLGSALLQAKPVGATTRRQLEQIPESPSRRPKALLQAISVGPHTQQQLDQVPVTQPRLEPLKPPLTLKPKRVPERVPASGILGRVPQSGNLGVALGVPCVICFGEEGTLKTLHCSYKAHVTCLKEHWSQNVATLCRMTDIRCPAEVAGCQRCLTEGDLRGVVFASDLELMKKHISDVDEQNEQLIRDLTQQQEQYCPMFQCAICLTEHEVEGCCTLPCQHRFCFESLQYHFDIIVRERRLAKLVCPADGCNFDLRSEEHIHIFQECLSEEVYHKLLEFLTRDDPHIIDCRHVGCEERVFLDDEDDYANLECARGHCFCAKCDNGPHRGISCEDQLLRLKENSEKAATNQALLDALAMGWKPCPMRCKFGGGYKSEEECDHVTCECGFEFCWSCGVPRQIPLMHDNRWHKPSCPYHTALSDVKEAPKYMPKCPGCQKMPTGVPCPFFEDDGYPQSYVRKV